jgi:hypothetical protein
MKPINRPNSNQNLIVSSNTITWEGPNIPCIELCTGDTVSSVVYKIAEHLCSIYSNIEDLKTLDLKCVIENCNSSCDLKDYSLKAIFEVLLNNDCKLKELIDSLEFQINNIAEGGLILSLDLSCLETHFNTLCIDKNQYTLNDLLQCFISMICDQETKIKDLSDRIQSLEVLITNLQNTVVTGTYTEPSFTTCANTLPLNHSSITPILAQLACDLRTDIGTATEIASALSQRCLSDYLSNSDIILNPTNLAQDDFNKWVIICDLLDRIKSLETNCCSPSCDDIKLGFSSVYTVSSQTLTLTFANNTGTSIPVGFIDNGSTITLSDTSNNTITLPITLSNGLIWISPSLSLDFSNPVTVKINSNFIDNLTGLICLDCFGQTIPAQEIECEICKICAANGNVGDEIQITYTTASNSTPQTVILTQGACLSFEVPTDKPSISQVITLTPGSVINLTKNSDCPSDVVIPLSVDPTCWFFPLPKNEPFTQTIVEGFDCASPNTGLVRFGYNVDSSKIYEFVELDANIGIIPLSGKIANVANAIPGVGTVGSYSISTSPNTPTYTSMFIDCNAVEGAIVYGGGGEFDTCQFMSGQSFTLDTLGFQIGPNYGIYLKIIGQPSTSIPEIKLFDPFSNQHFYTKGQLINSCPC